MIRSYELQVQERIRLIFANIDIISMFRTYGHDSMITTLAFWKIRYRAWVQGIGYGV